MAQPEGHTASRATGEIVFIRITICQTARIVNKALKTALQSVMTVDIAASTKNILRKAAHVQTAQHSLRNAA